jgi:hypothetical protein
VNIREFPAEYFVELVGEDFLVGRLSINKMNHNFWVEVDIVQKESKKIWAHVGDVHGVSELDEATYQSVQLLSDYIKKIKEK